MNIDKLRKAGDIHKKVQEYIKTYLLKNDAPKSQILLFDLASKIEQKIRKLCENAGNDEHNGGVAFPTGLSINNCAAHFTPNPNKGDKQLTLESDDLIKIDFGVHLDGNIIDGAFSHSYNTKFDKLIEASREATFSAIKMAGPDAILGEIGRNTQEIIESYEVDINNKNYPLKSVADLCGHQIEQYRIHSGKIVPNICIPYYKERMKSGEVYAIETFPTTGTGKVKERIDQCSHYMINYKSKDSPKNGSNVPLFKQINQQFSTLAFCKRWIMHEEVNKQLFSKITSKNLNNKLNKLIKNKVVNSYPPLYDVKGSYVSQTEKTIFINDFGCEILN